MKQLNDSGGSAAWVTTAGKIRRSSLVAKCALAGLGCMGLLQAQEIQTAVDRLEADPEEELVEEEPEAVVEALPASPLAGADEFGEETRIDLVPGKLGEATPREGLSGGLGTSVIYNSNLYRTAVDEQSGMLSSVDLSLNYRRGDQMLYRPYIALSYSAAYFYYWDEELNDFVEPFSHDFSGFIGIKGAKTTLTLTGSIVSDDGGGNNLTRIEPETQQSERTEYSLKLSGSRKLRRSSLNASLGWGLQEFDQNELTEAGEAPEQEPELYDLMSWDGSLGWSVSPLSAPKINLRPTVRFGTSEQKQGGEVDNINPALDLAYSYSPKLNFFGSIGADFRRGTFTSESEDGIQVEQSYTESSPTYEAGVSWVANPTTALSARIFRGTSSSALRGQSSSDRTGVSLGLSKAWPRGFSSSLSYSWQTIDYINNSGEDNSPEGSAGRVEDYHNVGVTLGRQFQLRPSIPLSASIFYQYSISTGREEEGDLEQSLMGLRLGISF